MIRQASCSTSDEEDPFSDAESGTVELRVAGKRKLAEREDILRSNMETLDLDSDDDILIVDTDEEGELLNFYPSPKESEPASPPINSDVAPAAGATVSLSPAPESSSSNKKIDEEFKKVFQEIRWTLSRTPDVEVIEKDAGDNEEYKDKPPPKWLRTVGEGEGGTLQCTVANPNVDPSTGGEGENDNCHMKWLCTLGLGEANKQKCGSSAETESINADTIRGLLDVYRKRRCDVLEPGGLVSTPLHVVKKMAKQHGEGVHLETVTYPNGLSRVELFSGRVRGVGEGATKRIAAQMAAIDMIEKVQLSGSGTSMKIPMSAFLPGWLTSNKVFSDLFALCKSKNLPLPVIRSGANLNEDGTINGNLPPFRAECWIGEDHVTIGESEAEIFARREAAREMYYMLCDVEYKDTPYAIGRACKRTEELESAGLKPIMSDYKKLWLLQNRVKNNMLTIPEEEEGLDGDCDVKELEKDLGQVESFAIRLKKKNIKVTVNKKFKSDSYPGRSINRLVNIAEEDKESEEGEESWY